MYLLNEELFYHKGREIEVIYRKMNKTLIVKLSEIIDIGSYSMDFLMRNLKYK